MIEFIPKTSTKNLNMQTFTIGVKMNGKKNIGFIMIGVPNKIGSLTEKVPGINDAEPTAFNCFDLAKNIKIYAKTKVEPVPPKFIT